MQDYNIYGSVEYHKFITENANLGLPKTRLSNTKNNNFVGIKYYQRRKRKSIMILKIVYRESLKLEMNLKKKEMNILMKKMISIKF